MTAARPRGRRPAAPGARLGRAGTAGLAVIAGCAVLALAAPLLVPAEALSATGAPGAPRLPPSGRFPLGTDVFGRSMVAVTVWGARVSLAVGLLSTAVAVGLGSAAGLLAGHFRGWVEVLLMRATDWFLALPTLVFAAVLATVLRPGVGTVVLAIGLTTWPATARLVRVQTLVVEAQPYVERARALGAGHWHVLRRHVFAAVAPLVAVQATLTVPAAILTEAALAFLGLADPTAVSWGTTIQLARQAGAISAGQWWILVPPGVAVATVSLAFTVCGRALESALHAHPAELA